MPVNCSIDAAVCCRLLAVCSVRIDRSWLPVAISAEAVEMLSVLERTWPTSWCSAPCIWPSARSRSPISSRRVEFSVCDRSPPAISVAVFTPSCKGTVTERVMKYAINAPTATLSNSNTSKALLEALMPALRCAASAAASSTWWSCTAAMAAR